MRISDWSSDVCSSDLKATSADRIALEWKIADGYYLYRHRTKAVAADGSRLGELDLPRGEPHEDEFFGHVETFRQRLAGSVPVQSADGGRGTLKVSYPGCEDRAIGRAACRVRVGTDVESSGGPRI